MNTVNNPPPPPKRRRRPRRPSSERADNQLRMRLLRPVIQLMFHSKNVPPDAFLAAATFCAKDWTRFSPHASVFAETSASASPPGQAEPPEVSP